VILTYYLHLQPFPASSSFAAPYPSPHVQTVPHSRFDGSAIVNYDAAFISQSTSDPSFDVSHQELFLPVDAYPQDRSHVLHALDHQFEHSNVSQNQQYSHGLSPQDAFASSHPNHLSFESLSSGRSVGHVNPSSMPSLSSGFLNQPPSMLDPRYYR
jgi:hypothetical protein